MICLMRPSHVVWIDFSGTVAQTNQIKSMNQLIESSLLDTKIQIIMYKIQDG